MNRPESPDDLFLMNDSPNRWFINPPKPDLVSWPIAIFYWLMAVAAAAVWAVELTR